MSIATVIAVTVPVILLVAARISTRREARAARRDALASRALLLAADRDRHRASQRLHNATLQELSAARMSLQTALRDIPVGHPARGPLDTTSLALGNAISEVLDTAGEIYPEDISATRLRVALDRMVRPARRAGWPVGVTVHFDTPPSPENMAILYRCIRECVKDVCGRTLMSIAQIDVLGDATIVRVRIAHDADDRSVVKPAQAPGVAMAAGLATAAGGGLHVLAPETLGQPTTTIIAVPVRTVQSRRRSGGTVRPRSSRRPEGGVPASLGQHG